MTEVTVRLYAAAAEAAGVHEVGMSISGVKQPLRSLIDELTRGRPGTEAGTPSLQRVCSQSSFLVNGTQADPDSTEIRPGDVVDILPPFAGG